ncbi:ABC transporter, integral membrane type 1 [Penicillium expansum]|uniref:ABC transporter, integral membrane type 1 n=1 Tax=Penicillium expansum TaxID=27334 RepID=A0A0A2IL36_PENEN|nr:ABC transporter, integral membrane type 1 [Penicillium expansum]KGO43779.1 ABC transporter, integral membrane type 1 [Penicillium expansum]KGO44632.1 ABC transporter, integral membrane type 1 [Penicillium expansum]KGO51945.1 ABC transporter, integral membrane type 1 [Penicillium expansum]
MADLKQCLLAVLFVLQVLFMAFQVRESVLHTRASLPAIVLNIIATFAASYASFIEDQRSVKPSDLLILYFSASSIFGVCRYLSLASFLFTVAILALESLPKTKILHSHYYGTTDEEKIGFWSRSFFIWVLPFLQTGYREALEVEDVPEVDTNLQGQCSGDKLRKSWDSASVKSHHRLIKVVFRAYGWACVSAIPPRLAYSCFNFAQPFLITATVNYIGGSSSSQPKVYGTGLIGAYILVYLGLAVSQAVYWRQTYRLLTMMRSGLISMIYDQTIDMAAADLTDSAAITLMGTDVERIVANLKNLHEAWASVIELGIAIWLLEREIGVACFIPLVISLGSVLAMVPVSSRSGKAQKQWIERVQKRLAVTANTLGNMKAVQMLGLSDVIFPLVSYLREIEVKTSLISRKLLIWQVALSNLPVVLAPFATFTTYAIISVVRHDGSILSAQAFASLALISLLTQPLLTFCQAMPALWQAVACFDRIEAYFAKGTPSSAKHEEEIQPLSTSEKFYPFLISFQNANIAWAPEKEPVLRDLSVHIHQGITMIVGPVGCGKSTLIESILHQHMVTNGSRTASFSRAAYCPQTPWITNDTIRNNIIGFLEFDQTWYDFTCAACGLQGDLDALSEGDMHMAGSGGISLSGGQKQRVALARAVYSRLEIVILDNVFSGLDSTSIALITDRLFGKDGHFKKRGISVILAMSTYQLLPHADQILMMNEGKITASGSYNEMLSNEPKIVLEVHKPTSGLPLATVEISNSGLTVVEKKDQTSTDVQSADDKETVNVKHQGNWPVYKYYSRSAGYGLLVSFLACTILEAFCTSFQTLWIQWWVEANEVKPNKQLGMYLGIYGLIFGLSCLSVFAGCFSQDLELIDMMLPIYAVNCVTSFVNVFINIIIICAMGRYLAVSIPFLGVVLFFIQAYYLRTSRQVRLLDIEAKAPLYTHFLETIHGISIIKAFDWGPQLREKSHSLLNRSQRPVYMLYSIQQWLILVLDLFVGAIAVILIAMITSLRDQFSGASIGVALNILLTLNQTLANALKMWTMTEISVGAVSRVQRFIEDTPSEERRGVSPIASQLPDDWPCSGAVEFTDVTAGYEHSTAPILKSLTMSIKPGEKIAVCGPSGSGKTSLIMALLQMLDLQSGRISVDGEDLAEIPRSTIRSRINVVPQDPFFMPGTLRFNLDPRQSVIDAELIHAVEKVGLWDQVCAKGGLDMEFSAADWSVGQRQLLALSRAIVRKSAVVILDEATSSVDSETEAIMQDVIAKDFSQQTIIAVVHRLRYIHWFDRVMLLKHGELVECDRAEALLQRDSDLRKLYLALQEPSISG